MISWESRGHFQTGVCVRCKTSPGVFQCRDCSGREMLCDGCIVDAHKQCYLHRISVSEYFVTRLNVVSTYVVRNGMAGILKGRPLKNLDFEPSLATSWEKNASTQRGALMMISLSSTPTVFTRSALIFVVAENQISVIPFSFSVPNSSRRQ